MKASVIAFVYNNCKNDARVLKEAKSLFDNGYDVKIMAIKDKTVPYRDQYEGVEIIRFDQGSFHAKILWLFRAPAELLFRVSKNALNAALIFVLAWIFRPALSLANSFRSTKRSILLIELSLHNPKKTPPLKTLRTVSKRNVVTTSFLAMLLSPVILLVALVFLPILLLIWVFYRFTDSVLKPRLMSLHRAIAFDNFRKKTLAYCIKHPADFYHGHDLSGLPAAVAAKKATGGKVIYDSHELYTERNVFYKESKRVKSRLIKKENQLLKETDKVITVSGSIADFLKDLHSLKERPTVIKNAPYPRNTQLDDDHNLSIRKSLALELSDKVMLYGGAITFNRGIENLIRSLTQNKYHLVLLGFGKPEYIEELFRIAQKNGVIDRFRHHPAVPIEEVAQYVSMANLGVAPIMNSCLSYYFCLPNKIFEYIQGGLPIICSNFPEMDAIVGGNKIGATFDPSSQQSIAKAASQVLESPNMYKQMQLNIETIQPNFTWEVEEKKLVSLYQSISE